MKCAITTDVVAILNAYDVKLYKNNRNRYALVHPVAGVITNRPGRMTLFDTDIAYFAYHPSEMWKENGTGELWNSYDGFLENWEEVTLFDTDKMIASSRMSLEEARFYLVYGRHDYLSIDKVGDFYIGCVPGKEQLMVVIGKGKDVVALANSTYRDV